MQLAPGRSSCDIQFGGQSLFGRGHQMLGLGLCLA